MNERINDIVSRMKALEMELEAELEQVRTHFMPDASQKIRFDPEARQQHRQHKINLFLYTLLPRPRHVLVAPFIYVLIFPLLLLDLLGSLYHAVGFPLLNIPKLKRSDHFIEDID